ncbi:unnamed protein product, partial [Effrenium voratum]
EQVASVDNGWNLHAAPQVTAGQRGDEIVWVDEEVAVLRYQAPAVGRAVEQLKALAAALNPAMSERHRKLAAAGDGAHTLQPKAPASEDAVLTVSPRAQLASYRGETGYVCHQDNRFRPSHGTRLNSRELTAILYANKNWRPEEGGALRIFPHSESLEAAPGDEHPAVEITPAAGTLVVFCSELWHEVQPAHRPRRALTLWILRPEEEESWMPGVF